MPNINLPGLCALICVTPETHPHLVRVERKIIPYSRPPQYMFKREYLSLPPLDTPEGDDVYLPRLLRWLNDNGFIPCISGDEDEMHPAHCSVTHITWCEKNTDGGSFTLALLNAALAAGVPEIVALVEKENNND